MTQKAHILKYLRENRTITPIQALDLCKCFRLASVIRKLKDEGHEIITQLIVKETNEGRKVFARYNYVAPPASRVAV